MQLLIILFKGNSRVVRKLLIRGADRDRKDKHGKKPADLARDNDYLNIYTMIVREENILIKFIISTLYFFFRHFNNIIKKKTHI